MSIHIKKLVLMLAMALSVLLPATSMASYSHDEGCRYGRFGYHCYSYSHYHHYHHRYYYHNNAGVGLAAGLLVGGLVAAAAVSAANAPAQTPVVTSVCRQVVVSRHYFRGENGQMYDRVGHQTVCD